MYKYNLCLYFQEPWLDMKIAEPRHHSRHRRSEALVCDANSTEDRCCRYPLEIGFAELFGWDWVIAPTHAEVNYCQGRCRHSMLSTGLGSWIQEQLPDAGGPCCTASKRSALPLLYFDQDFNIMYQILQNIKVEKCLCAN